MDTKQINAIVKKMTLEEKVAMLSGADFWHTKALERLNIPQVMVSDGPHGLRKQNLEIENGGVNNSIKAVCFPTAVGLASSFNEELVEELGQALGNECQAENVGTILGPGNNIKRSPLCGRNFEYLSEDPYLSGKIAAAHIKGVQSKGVGTSLKHFCANNQEYKRNSYNAVIDERTFREIYLKTFEIAVKEAQPWTVMCAYNLVNGVQASENKRILTDILRDEWGFKGLVMSDWGAVNHRPEGIMAGLDLEMPGSNGAHDKTVLDAVKSGKLKEADIDKCVARVLDFVYKAVENHKDNVVWDKEKDHILARQIAKECMVLLKNENKVLPLEGTDVVLVVGGFATTPRFQGGGSSHINSARYDSVKYALQGNSRVVFEEGFSAKDDSRDEILIKRAIERAKEVDKVVIFAGLPDLYESEGYDRTHMELPPVQNELIFEICKVCNEVIVVLENGSPVTMPWIDEVEAVLETYLPGEGAGIATVQVLYGNYNPSGRLAETFPLRVEDTPSYFNFGTDADTIYYNEGIFTGYRYYSKRKAPVLFPFGYGLSYSEFEYGKLAIDTTQMYDDETVELSIDIINISDIAGQEVVQIYVESDIPGSKIMRPVRELKAFKKIKLDAKEKQTVTFTLGKDAFAYYDTDISDWYVEEGDYKIEICKNADEVICYKRIHVSPRKPKKTVYTENTIYKEFKADPKAWEIVKGVYEEHENNNVAMGESDESCKEAFGGEETKDLYLRDLTLRAIVNMDGGRFTLDDMNKLINKLNK